VIIPGRRCMALPFGILLATFLAASTAPVFAQLTDQDIEQLRERAKQEDWTFTVGRTSATYRSVEQLCGAIEPDSPPPDARRGPDRRTRETRSLPAAFSWRDHGGCTPIKDQGLCGCCWAFAACGVYESAIRIKLHRTVDLSEQWLVSCARSNSNHGCDGGYYGEAFRFMRCHHPDDATKRDPCGDYGAVLETDFPYVASDAPCGCPYDHPYCLDSWFLVPDWGEPTVEEIKQAIYDIGPVATSVHAYTPAFMAYTGGVFNACVDLLTDHAIVLVGWDDNQGSNGVWILRNSWGTDWGENGYMRIEYGCSRVGEHVATIDLLGVDCNQNQIPDLRDIADGDSEDCNANEIPDECDINVNDPDHDGNVSADCNSNGIPDECEPDGDHDGVPNDCDGCPEDPNKSDPGVCGCGTPDTDSDGDNTPDCIDECPHDRTKTAPGACGCGQPETDSDNDGTPDCVDECPHDPDKTAPGKCGCGTPDIDTDEDGTYDCDDGCPDDPDKIAPGACGCGTPDIDTDMDGTCDCHDECPEDRRKTEPGECGCGTLDTDRDRDGVPDCHDDCPSDPNKIEPGICGCGKPDDDTDGDGTPDCHDECPEDPLKTEAGDCGCGELETDTDGDGTPDCIDQCPNDADKIHPGICGCGEPDEGDRDGDGTLDCADGCPDDPEKFDPGMCGCGEPDAGDRDGDGTLDCVDGCPDDPNKIDPGRCGCGVPETTGCGAPDDPTPADGGSDGDATDGNDGPGTTTPDDDADDSGRLEPGAGSVAPAAGGGLCPAVSTTLLAVSLLSLRSGRRRRACAQRDTDHN